MSTRRSAGFSLLELMIALALGLILMLAFITALDRCRSAMTSNESMAELASSARQAIDVLVLDLEHAGFTGLPGSQRLRFMRGGSVFAEGDALRQPDGATPRAPVAGLPAGAHDCGVNFALDLSVAVQGINAGAAPLPCAPTAAAGGVRSGTDSLTIRRASLERMRPRAGRVQVYLRRLEAHGFAMLFADGAAPGPLDDDAEVRDVEVHTYYIASNSVGRPGWPALRVKSLTESGGAAQFRDEEVLPGVEDLQVEFGVRASASPTAPPRFVLPDSPELRGQRVIAVRAWLRIRADSTERDHHDPRTLRYSDATFDPDDREARQRRLLLERTVVLRNSRLP